MVYSTCSIYQRENEDVVAAVLEGARADGFELVVSGGSSASQCSEGGTGGGRALLDPGNLVNRKCSSSLLILLEMHSSCKACPP